jgi:hypothetical protein
MVGLVLLALLLNVDVETLPIFWGSLFRNADD